ncbi:EAL domain-containing protein [Mesorhizobium sp. CAU 1741]|uniref:bifunctional diguanylate cyclase/phosphodiesterase n=1 Tax=Mesorhizobium sp. CAU 1741 TaxID=3140366 RepID=UPI00325BF53B
MLTIYNCVVNDHDLKLVFLAAIICAISALTAVKLLDHVRHASRKARYSWIGLTAASIGFGIWATHFVAMLAFAPALPTAYDAVLTILSLAVAVVITGVGVAVATSRDTRDHHLVGGSIIGAGIASMHFIGMAAFEVPGALVWDQRFVAVALVVAVALGALALHVALARRHRTRHLTAALVLTLAICGLHFTAMAAVTIQPDALASIPASSISSTWLAFGVACAAFTILLFSAIALWIDIRDLRRSRDEEQRMRDLVNAAVEGLVVCRDGIVVTANASFISMAGIPLADMTGLRFGAIVALDALAIPNKAVEASIVRADATRLPVEVIEREIDYDGTPHMVYAVRDLRERRKAEADIRHLAMHDALTDLPNRRAFNERLELEIEAHRGSSGRHLALLCLDLDRFKEVNDLFGHAAGDAMLQKVAACAGSVLKRDQMLARLGGDEFAIILPNLAEAAQATQIAQAILCAFHERNVDANNEGLMSTSIGVAVCPDDATDGETLVSYADTALYCAKSDGRNTWRQFDNSMGQEVRSRRIMEHELRHAISRNELSLAYQPQKKLDTGETIGFEALLRWNHPERGNISPAVFIPIAEENGTIVPIGEWVLDKACMDAARWSEDVIVAVNVSAVQLHTRDFAQTVHGILLKSGLAPSRLELEITETALVRDMNRALATLRRIKALGVKVAMDDFGTGYSSLSNLRAFPFDKIKIDASFIRSVDTNQQAATIVKAVLGIGRGLGLPVLAEGVETSEELAFLSQEFCQIGQGYLLGRPAPLDGVEETLSSGRAAVAASAA